MKISTRTRAILLSTSIMTMFFVFQTVELMKVFDFNFKFDFIELLVISFIMYFGTTWVLNFRVAGERFFTIVLFPALSIFILNLYIGLFINSIFSDVSKLFAQIIASIVVGFVSYILILTSNLLNLGYLENIPLTQAAKAAHYVLTLISMYLFFTIIFSNSVIIIIKLALVLVISYLFTSIALWTIELEFKKRIMTSILISLVMVIFAFVLSIWPITSEYFALILSLVYYMVLGIALEIREVLNNRIWVEYTFLFVIIVLILFIASSWGINGRII